MTEALQPSRLERWLPLVAGVFIAAPTLLASYLPMSDLPMHEGVVGLLRHFNDDRFMPGDLYFRNFGHPNQLFHLASWLLSYVVSTSTAVRLVVAASQIGIFLGGARLADYLGRSRWGVLLLTPLALGFLFYWGMVANVLGLAVFLALLPDLDRSSENATPRALALTCVHLVLLFLAHETLFLAAVAILVAFALLKARTVRALAMRAVPIAFAVVVAYGHLVFQKRFQSEMPTAPVSFLPFRQKIELLPNALFGSYDAGERLILFLLAVGAALLLARPALGELWPSIRGARIRAIGLSGVRDFLHRHRFAVVSVCFGIGYFVVPFNWNGGTMLHERALGPSWALMCILVAPTSPPRAVARIAAAVVPVGVIALAWPQFVEADRTFKDLSVILEQIPYRASVTQASLDIPPARTRTFSAGTWPGRVVAERGGRTAMTLTMSPISPIQITRAWRWPEQEFRIVIHGSMYMIPAHDLKRYGWVIGQSRDPAAKDLFIRALRPDAEFVAESGEWLLFRSTHPQASLLTPEEYPPSGSEMMIDRAKKIVMENIARRKAERDKSAEDAGAP